MKLFKFALLVFPYVFFLSCSTTPVACFDTDNVNPEVIDTVHFSNCSTDAKSYLWTFGDGSSSHEKSPSYKYSMVGQFLVTLVSYSKDEEKSSLVTQIINVKEETIKTGQVIFWKEGNSPWDIPAVLILIGNVPEGYQFSGIINQNLSAEPDCDASGALTLTLPVGSQYPVQIINQSNGYQESTQFSILKDQCTKIKID